MLHTIKEWLKEWFQLQQDKGKCEYKNTSLDCTRYINAWILKLTHCIQEDRGYKDVYHF